MTLKILIHEYFTGGGWDGPEIPSGIASEGLAMLSSVLTDFKKWGAAEIHTTLDKRLSSLVLQSDRINNINPDKYWHEIEKLAQQHNFALIIAPETKGALARLCKIMEDNSVCLLGSGSGSIITAGDKWECHRLFEKGGLPVPETVRACVETAVKSAIKMGFPLVIKPVDRAGCEGVNLVSDSGSLEAVIRHNPVYMDGLLLQRFIAGEHISISMLVSGHDVAFLSLNRQFIRTGIPFEYEGGEVMAPSLIDDDTRDIVCRAINMIPGLKGYVGMDLVMTDRGCSIIEINPRLTTSYVGLRRAININLAGSIWDACVNKILPRSVDIYGNGIFDKDDMKWDQPPV